MLPLVELMPDSVRVSQHAATRSVRVVATGTGRPAKYGCFLDKVLSVAIRQSAPELAERLWIDLRAVVLESDGGDIRYLISASQSRRRDWEWRRIAVLAPDDDLQFGLLKMAIAQAGAHHERVRVFRNDVEASLQWLLSSECGNQPAERS